MIKTTILFMVLLFCLPAYADETYVYGGAWSKHFLTDKDYNETHDLIAVKYNNVMAGYFVNSYNLESYFITYDEKVGNFKNFDTGVYLGAIHGYTKCLKDDDSSKNLCPFAVPYAYYDKYDLEPGLLIVGNALTISFRYSF